MNANNMEKQDLLKELEQERRGLFGLQLNKTAAQVKDYSQFKKKRKKIAQLLTLINKKVN